MISGLGRVFKASAAALLLTANMAVAQETSTNRVDAMTDWSVFEGDSPKECWAVSTYKESVNTDASGRIKSVTRGDILLMVFFRPGAGVTGQLAFTGGYPFAKGSTVNMNIGGTQFELYTEGEWAWPATPQDDAKIVTAMKRGANAVLTAKSGRGTITKDTFSLLGFTAAVEDAGKRCG
ncbi:hypothetical protein TRP8649_00778 [Pelagimonas phthalicica]|uniref:Invasion protein IalB, involved in pathogenesis n=1 Tax=Pelagimonas phthalicica TaxID=1037362 RepID=A0A238J8L7_9RHOB|nr:invasion associated locus B family protein [Pelagimonas phthalicica]TDS94778.1 hypothetical protein CLV87_1293 [Pelagimonas phthalicica]SMX26693.1 hypothetical protein TRP8649_00778 [Pelagimonas phthalicica]